MPSYPYPKLELKYCERCGGLWLRPQGTDAIYCAACATAVRDLPPSRGGTPPGALHAFYVNVVILFATLVSVAGLLGGASA